MIGKKHFIIRYRIDTKGYYLKDTGEGSGTFVRVDRPLVSCESIDHLLLDTQQWISDFDRRLSLSCLDTEPESRSQWVALH